MGKTMKVKLSTKIMKSIVSKLIAKLIYKKCGRKVEIHIDELELDSIDGEITIRTSVEAKLSSDEFKKLIKSHGLD